MIDIDILKSLDEIAPETWDACACPEGSNCPKDPFTTYRFLRALETSGSVGLNTGWNPLYLRARRNHETLGVAPLYVKYHSQGEYIFDHSWAQAYERAGGHYYPKLQITVPFTPATGRRFLVKPEQQEEVTQALISGAQRIAEQNGLSSLHITFCTQTEAEFGEKCGLMRRETQQFHWENDNYTDFNGFLDALSSRKRKTIRKERQRAQDFGGTIIGLTGAALQSHHWDAFWRFYQDTGARKWGQPYLTREFFDEAQNTLRDDVYLSLAEKDGEYIAGALNFIGQETLYGRYWGCTEHHPCLHFELCYYQAIDFAIKHRLKRIEAGAQGEHKLARGYMPCRTFSLHWAANPSFAEAIDQYLTAERRAIDEDIEILTQYGPFRKCTVEEKD